VPKIEHFGDGNVYINPGSVTLPRENSPKSYILYSDGTFTIKDLDSNPFLEYKAK
jgi:predicted phosphodiesterase